MPPALDLCAARPEPARVHHHGRIMRRHRESDMRRHSFTFGLQPHLKLNILAYLTFALHYIH